MARVKRGFKARRRRNKILKLAKGYHFDRRNKFRHAVHTVKRALHNAYKARKMLKRNMRSLWIVRISAAVKDMGSSYSRFIFGMKEKGIMINRKMLAELAVSDSAAFKAIFDKIK
jgi:large subunit ribosomal protein L20